jgi:hypothetical protein
MRIDKCLPIVSANESLWAFLRFALTLSFFLSVAHAAVKPENESIASRLISLRADVERLSRENDFMNKQNQSSLESLVQRRTEIEQSLRKERMREEQLRAKSQLLRRQISPKKAASPQEKQFLNLWLSELGTMVHATIPFRRAERLESLARISHRLEAGESPETITAELWAFSEKELKTTKDNSYEIVDLDFASEKKKAEIARIGMLHFVYRTSDGQFGYTHRSANEWQLKSGESQGEKAAIQRLLTKLKEQNGRGYFEIPGLKPSEVVQ